MSRPAFGWSPGYSVSQFVTRRTEIAPAEAGARRLAGQFGGRALAFLLPVLVVAAGLEVALWRTAESWLSETIVAWQKDNRSLYMRELLPQDFVRYKLDLIALRRPRVLVVGSSRGMQIRSDMLGVDDLAFVNGGGLVETLGDLETLFDRLPAGARPGVIVLAIDHWWFNPAWADAPRPAPGEGALDWRAHLTALRRLATQPAAVADGLFGPPATARGLLGLTARRTGSGFRADGSLAQVEWEFADRETPPIGERVAHATHQFAAASTVSPERVARLGAFLNRARALGVDVVGFAPPFSSSVVAALRVDDRHRGLMCSFSTAMSTLFAAADRPFVDATDLSTLGLDDSYMFDPWHAAETFHVHLIRRLLMVHPRTAAALPAAAAATADLLASPTTTAWYAAPAVTARASR